MTHEDLALLTAWLSEHGHTAEQVAYAVEKPWKFETELATARLEAGWEGGLHDRLDRLVRRVDVEITHALSERARQTATMNVCDQLDELKWVLDRLDADDHPELPGVKARWESVMDRLIHEGFAVDPDTGKRLAAADHE